jgi:hypothetical protein
MRTVLLGNQPPVGVVVVVLVRIVVVGALVDVVDEVLVVVELVEVVVDETMVVVVVVVVLVVVLAFTIETPNDEIAGTMNALLVLYPETVRCTPSAMNLLFDFGVNAEFQSAIVKFG